MLITDRRLVHENAFLRKEEVQWYYGRPRNSGKEVRQFMLDLRSYCIANCVGEVDFLLNEAPDGFRWRSLLANQPDVEDLVGDGVVRFSFLLDYTSKDTNYGYPRHVFEVETVAGKRHWLHWKGNGNRDTHAVKDLLMTGRYFGSTPSLSLGPMSYVPFYTLSDIKEAKASSDIPMTKNEAEETMRSVSNATLDFCALEGMVDITDARAFRWQKCLGNLNTVIVKDKIVKDSIETIVKDGIEKAFLWRASFTTKPILLVTHPGRQPAHFTYVIVTKFHHENCPGDSPATVPHPITLVEDMIRNAVTANPACFQMRGPVVNQNFEPLHP